MKRNLIYFIMCAVAMSGAIAVRADDKTPPAWLQQAAKAQVPSYGRDVDAVVLLYDQTVTVDSNGMATITTDYAVKVLGRAGRDYASAEASYLQSSSKVRDIHAWLLRTDSSTKAYGKDQTLDMVSDPDDIYNEYRVKTINARDDVDVGMIFGYETVVEEHPLFTQDLFGFQRRLPTLFSRYTLNLPSGWQATNVTFNHDDIKPRITGNSYSWELRELAPIPYEPDGPSISNLSPRIAVNYFKTDDPNHFSTWADVSRWGTGLSDPQVIVDDDIAAKARDLTAGAATEIDKIRAIGAFVQNLRYISIDIGIAFGNGYKPRPSSLVLARGYGDCKDKANLMRALLRSIKIDAYPLVIYSGDPTIVREQWPSPGQFNHCIIAIKVSRETTAASIIENEQVGRLLIFDATDPYTQVGDFPDHEQGSYALLLAGDKGQLLRMPSLPPANNKLERNAEITLEADGAVSGKIAQRASGQAGAYERARIHELSATQYRTSLEKWLTNRIAGGSLTKSEPLDHKDQNRFDLDLEFKAPMYAQIMQGRLMMFKPAMVGRLDQFTPIEGKRMTPIIIDSSSYSETIKVKLPDGFVVDEMPEADKIDTSFGSYNSSYQVANGYLLFSRTLVLKRTVVPATGYDEVGRFFGVVRNAEVSPVVLVRK